MQSLRHNGFLFTLPKPLLVVVEDVGWWQGRDGSAAGEPFRSGMDREHCLEDYQALDLLARCLNMRIQLSMVLCEWDRSNLLRKVPSSTWMGEKWDNPYRQQAQLEAAADFLRINSKHLEIGLHGVGHEFWKDKKMERSEFHDSQNILRSAALVRQHLDAFAGIMEENRLGAFPHSFVPPALHHSFGNADDSFQAILRNYGVTCVTTILSRARQYVPPLHEQLTWEDDVLLIERHEAPVKWHVQAAPPALPHDGPVVALHWKNLLHSNPCRNGEVIAPWAELLSSACCEFNRMAARDTISCWSQFAYHSLAHIRPKGPGVEIDISRIPKLSAIQPRFFLKIRDEQNRSYRVTNGKIVSLQRQGSDILICLDSSEALSGIRPLYVTPREANVSK
jgi:hypothetical protein